MSSSENSTVPPAAPVLRLSLNGATRNHEGMQNNAAFTTRFPGITDSLDTQNLITPNVYSINTSDSAFRSFSNMTFAQPPTFSESAEDLMHYSQPVMPLAAFTQGLQDESNLFPVFAPAWLDQASALQSPQPRESDFIFPDHH